MVDVDGVIRLARFLKVANMNSTLTHRQHWYWSAYHEDSMRQGVAHRTLTAGVVPPTQKLVTSDSGLGDAARHTTIPEKVETSVG
ncbi:hypothetical protein OUZ56_010298 [Daphnia magna]|uniref:Uncharacterized protein n=1 Tax=Daphnia magna TaxID=35525 RepID=A0ABR0AI83_9CRUS|nr:hypothetical protein OUZ56_010298 [Daphnia magna]